MAMLDDHTEEPRTTRSWAVVVTALAWIVGLGLFALSVIHRDGSVLGMSWAQLHYASLGLVLLAALGSSIGVARAPSNTIEADVAILGLAIFAGSLMLPAAAIDGKDYPGALLLVLGSLTVFWGAPTWLANPTYGVALFLISVRRYRSAAITSATSAALGVTFLGWSGADGLALGLRGGYWLWLLALASPLTGVVLAWARRLRTQALEAP